MNVHAAEAQELDRLRSGARDDVRALRSDIRQLS